MACRVVWFCAFSTDQAAIALIATVNTEVLVNLVMFCASYLYKHFAVCYALDRPSSCHILTAFTALGFSRSANDLGLNLAVDKFISNEEFFIVIAVMLHENEMPKVVKNSLFGASWTDNLILCLHFPEDKKKSTNYYQLLLGSARIGSMDDGRSVDLRVLGLVFCKCCICENCS